MTLPMKKVWYVFEIHLAIALNLFSKISSRFYIMKYNQSSLIANAFSSKYPLWYKLRSVSPNNDMMVKIAIGRLKKVKTKTNSNYTIPF